MKRLAIALTLLAALSAAAPGGAYVIMIPPELPAKVAELTKEYQRIKLGQVALLIDDYSQGKSKLLIGAAAGADARTGNAMRLDFWGDVPVISVCPASVPVEVELDGIGCCQLLGAVAILVSATAAEGDDKLAHKSAPADVYLLAYGVNDGWLEEARLLSVAVDDEGRRTVSVALRTLAKRHETRLIPSSTPEGEAIPAATVLLPTAEEVSNANPASRAELTLAWKKLSYRFSLDLGLIFL